MVRAACLGLVVASAIVRADDGERLYLKECSKCHGMLHSGLMPDSNPENRLLASADIKMSFSMPYGPNLFGVIGRTAGTEPGFDYSKAFLKALRGATWTAATIDAFITDTQAMAPGTRMFYAQPDPAVRRAIVQHLKRSTRG